MGSPFNNREIDNHEGMTFNKKDIATTKPSIMLPKASEKWNLANGYFKCVFIDLDFTSDSIDSINESICLMNNTIIIIMIIKVFQDPRPPGSSSNFSYPGIR